MKEVIIYQSGYPKSGTILVRKEPRFSLLPRAFLLGGILGLFLLFFPFLFMEVKYRVNRPPEKQVIVRKQPEKGFAEVVNASDIAVLQPVNPEFSLIIPKIGLNSEIIVNVNPAEKKEYGSFLKKGVVHAAGSYFPGQKGSIYLFGHSTDYVWNLPRFNAVFYLLKELEEGDEINVFYQGKRYLYQVSSKKTVSASNLYYLKPKLGEEEIVLQTCWPPGTNWKRLLVFAQPI